MVAANFLWSRQTVTGEKQGKQPRAVICFQPVLRESLPHFVFGIFEAVGNKVNRLVLGDGVLLEAGLVEVKGQDFGLVRQTILQKKRLQCALTPLFSSLNRKCGITE